MKGKGMLKTDEEALDMLQGENPHAGRLAQAGLYRIFRLRDKLSVEDAYMKVLDHVIAICETQNPDQG